MPNIPEKQIDEEGNLTDEEKAFRRGFDHASSAQALFVKFLIKYQRLEESDLTVSEVVETFKQVASEYRGKNRPISWYTQKVQNEVAERLNLDPIEQERREE